ncbi:hypothetical protein LCGC14_2967040 [marine sediment metagenome]|uniref:Uncharacterized protein n=1 Tax=marine sediment metagenome TaxID=412755 RepID=A0A0F8XXX9_9ZZZZ
MMVNKTRRTSYLFRVGQYIDEHTTHSKADIASALDLTEKQVDSCIWQLRKRGYFPESCQWATKRLGGEGLSRKNITFTARDILAIKRIGVEKVKEILTLLKEL